jgi:hypothetical protein
VRFTCADALSGVQECASDAVLTTDGDSLTATGAATDRADNAATTAVRGLRIDSRAPSTRAALQCAAGNGWCRGGTATVALTAADQPGLSGVEEIRWSTDGGTTWRSDPGPDTVVTLPLSGSGTATLKYFAVDAAGNRETANGVEVRFDTIAPAVTHTVTPVPNAAGWNRSDATVSFSARDDSDGSSVDPATVTPDRTVTEETTGLVVRGSAADRAGNVGTDSVSVKLDRTAPTVTASATGTRGTNGWYTSPVTVSFDCADGGSVASGIATCTPDVVLSTDGAGQVAAGRAVDSAGNSATTSVTDVAIDSTPPVITRAGASDGRIYVLGDPAIPTDATACTAADLGSGVASCDLEVSGGRPNGVGTFTFTATATDRAGNTSTRTGSFRVVYRWDGFRQPISDTAHQVTLGLSVFKGGSSVPAKFQLKRADGTVVQASAPPQWVVPTPGSPIVGLTGELLFTEPETTGTTYRWDAGGQQYGFTWSTRGAQNGLGYRLGVALDDGQTHWVTIGLR